MIATTDIEKLANLARLKLETTEKESLTKDIDSILTYVDQLKKATINIDHASVPGIVHNVTRQDLARDIRADDRERLLVEAPDREGEFIAVKKIIAQD